MGTPKFIKDIEDDVKGTFSGLDDIVRRGFSSLDDKLNLSELHKDAANVLTLGTTGNYEKAKRQEELAADAARTLNETRQATQRAVNFRNMMKAAENTQQSAAELMNLAASGGFADSSAVMQSLSSGKAQQLETSKHYGRLESLGITEAAAMDAQATAEKKYQKKMFYVSTGLNVMSSAAGGAMGG